MKNGKFILTVMLMSAALLPVHGNEGTLHSPGTKSETAGHNGGWYGIEGYAGPGWLLFFRGDGEKPFFSLTPVQFRVSDSLYLGPVFAYDEVSIEEGGSFLGGIRGELYFDSLSAGFYATSASLSLLAGAGGVPDNSSFAFQAVLEANANVIITPTLVLAAGPALSVRHDHSVFTFLPGISFSLKEGTRWPRRAIVSVKPGGPHISGMWQGLWIVVNGEPVFLDGGGTRFVLPSGLAFGICGAFLKNEIREGNSTLAVMQLGLTGEWTWRPVDWFALSPRLTTGAALYGWVDESGQIEGGPHFMARPELSAYIGVLPFVEIGGGIGYQFVTGEAGTSIPIMKLSSPAFTIQARVGAR